jgi:hypothetical protein
MDIIYRQYSSGPTLFGSADYQVFEICQSDRAYY